MWVVWKRNVTWKIPNSCRPRWVSKLPKYSRCDGATQWLTINQIIYGRETFQCCNRNIYLLCRTWSITTLFITCIPEMMQMLIGTFVLPGSISKFLIWTHFSMWLKRDQNALERLPWWVGFPGAFYTWVTFIKPKSMKGLFELHVLSNSSQWCFFLQILSAPVIN